MKSERPPLQPAGEEGNSIVTDLKIIPRTDGSQEPHQVLVELRPATDGDSAAKAYADVTIAFTPDSWIKISGFTVLQSANKPLWVAPPARKGKQRYFDIVALSGRIRQAVDEAVKTEYQRFKGAR